MVRRTSARSSASLHDVSEGWVTRKRAEAVYGVVAIAPTACSTPPALPELRRVPPPTADLAQRIPCRAKTLASSSPAASSSRTVVS